MSNLLSVLARQINRCISAWSYLVVAETPRIYSSSTTYFILKSQLKRTKKQDLHNVLRAKELVTAHQYARTLKDVLNAQVNIRPVTVQKPLSKNQPAITVVVITQQTTAVFLISSNPQSQNPLNYPMQTNWQNTQLRSPSLTTHSSLSLITPQLQNL